jgi:hypothetical protein
MPGGTVKPHRVLSLVAALGLFAMFIPLTTSVVLAWSAPGIASVCSDDQAVHNWTVTLPTEADYNIQWADNAGFASPTDVTMSAGANSLSTPASVTTLYVRWASEPNTESSATWSGGACSSPSPTGTPCVVVDANAAATACPTPFESFQGETAVPGPTITPPPTGAGSNGSSNNSTPLFALLICFAFGGLGLMAVQAQRWSIRR